MAKFTEEVVLKLQDQFSAQANKINGSLGMLQKGFALAAGAVGVGSLVTAMVKCVKAYGEQEKAVMLLENALKVQGRASKAVSEDLQAQANALQSVTVYSDDAIISQQAYLAQLGFTSTEIKKIISASVDLASATGTSLDTAVQKLTKTYSGHTRELAQMIPQLKTMTEEQLRAGEAVDMVAKQMSGAAQTEGASTLGKWSKLWNAFGDVMEVVGEKISKAESKLGFVDALTKEMNRLANGSSLEELETKLKNVNYQLDLMQNVPGGPTREMIALQKRLTDQINAKKEALESGTKELQKAQSAEEKAASIAKKNLKLAEDKLKAEEKFAKRKEQLTDKWPEFERKMYEASAEGFEKINMLRDKDLRDLEEFSRHQVGNSEDRARVQNEIESRALREKGLMWADFAASTGEAMKRFGEEVHTNMAGAIESLGTSIQSNISGLFGPAGKMFQAAFGFAQGLQGIFSAFDEDTRSRFVKLTDMIDSMNSALNDLERRIDSMRDQKDRLNKRLEGGAEAVAGGIGGIKRFEQDVRDLGQGEFGKTSDMQRQILDRMIKRFRFRITSKGDIGIFLEGDDEALGFKDSVMNEWVVQRSILSFDERQMKIVFEYFLRKVIGMDLIDLSAYGVPQESRAKPAGATTESTGSTGSSGSTGGSFDLGSQSATGLSNRALTSAMQGAARSGGSMIIQIQTIDSQGVKQFIENRLQPMMRDMSRNRNTIFVSPQGVSSKA